MITVCFSQLLEAEATMLNVLVQKDGPSVYGIIWVKNKGPAKLRSIRLGLITITFLIGSEPSTSTRRFWPTDGNRKWVEFPFNLTSHYHIEIVKYLFLSRDD